MFSQSQDPVPPPQQAAVVSDRKTVTPLPAEDSGKRKIPLGAGGNKQSSNNTQQKKKAKTQKKKKEKDPNRPKKKKNAYDFWAEVARPNLPPNNTDMNNGRYKAKQLGEKWRAMSQHDKAPWERMASEDRIRWQEEMKVYEANKNKNNGPDEKKTAAKNDEGTIQFASMPAVSNPAVEGHKALARAMGEEDTKKNPSNAKGTTTEFINAKVVNNNSNDAHLPTAASQKSIESVDVDVLVEDPSSQEGMKLTKAPIKKGSSITTNNGNKENNNNGSSKAAAGKGGGLMASVNSGISRLFNKGKNEGGMDKENGKDGAQKVRGSMLFMCFALGFLLFYSLTRSALLLIIALTINILSMNRRSSMKKKPLSSQPSHPMMTMMITLNRVKIYSVAVKTRKLLSQPIHQTTTRQLHWIFLKRPLFWQS